MPIKIPTKKTVSEAASALQAAVQGNHFGVMQVHNLKETMTEKGVEFARECLIFEVCQPQQAKKVLDENMSISTALPCRISVATTYRRFAIGNGDNQCPLHEHDTRHCRTTTWQSLALPVG